MGLRELIVAALTKPDRVPVDERLAGESRRRRKREFAGVRPVLIGTAKDPRYRRERSGGYGSTAPYLPPRLGLPARRSGRPVGHVPVRPAPKGRSLSGGVGQAKGERVVLTFR